MEVSEEVYEKAQAFIEETFFDEVDIEKDFVSGYTTLTFINMKYVLRLENTNVILIVKLTKNLDDTGFFEDEVECSFSYNDKETDEILKGVNVFKDDMDRAGMFIDYLIEQDRQFE